MDPARDPRSDRRPALARRSRRQPTYFERARRWLRPPRRLRPTRAGWLFFVITFGVGFAALNTGNNLLYLVLSLMLAFLVLSGVLSEAALRGIRVRRRLPRELQAETEARIAVEILNDQSRLASFALVVEDRFVDPETGRERAAGRCFALRIAPRATELRTYRLRPSQRGPLAFRGFVVFTRFPFGLFSKALLIEAEEEALVYPATDPLRLPPEFGAARRRGDERDGHGPRGADVEGLRDYRPGDGPRRVHWRASARIGAWLVRERERESDALVEVRLRTAGLMPGPGFERGVRRAASEIAALLEAGLRVALRTDADLIEAGAGGPQRTRLFCYLARVEPSGVATEAA